MEIITRVKLYTGVSRINRVAGLKGSLLFRIKLITEACTLISGGSRIFERGVTDLTERYQNNQRLTKSPR